MAARVTDRVGTQDCQAKQQSKTAKKTRDQNNRGGARPSFKARDAPPNSLRCNITSHGLDAMRKVSAGNLVMIHEKSMTKHVIGLIARLRDAHMVSR
jgi:hypothetical protein